jgi:hypothetical protein
MQELTGVFITDGQVRSGERFTIHALEDVLWQSFRKGTPTNISHDIHRPIGWSRMSSLYVSHEMAYVLGKIMIPETNREREDVMRARAAFLHEKIEERVNEYYNAFYTELNKNHLIVPEGKFLSNGIVMYGAKDVVFKAFPFLDKTLFDKNGLIHLSEINNHFTYKGCGVFIAKETCFALLLHPYLRRTLSRYNNFNTGFIEELMKTDNATTPVRLRIDELFIGYAPSYIDNVEFEYWYGPHYSDEITSIPNGLASYVPDDVERFYNPVCKTEFIWEIKDGKRQFEMEEVAAEDMPRMENGKYGCRYLHSLFDPSTGIFDHFDGAIRAYNEDLMEERRERNMSQMGHGAEYTKIFRIDGPIPIHQWKSLITHYLKDNQDVYRYFNVEVPFKTDAKESNGDPLDKYAPRVLAPGDGVRLLVSYHEKINGDKLRFFSSFDLLTTPSGEGDATDLLVVDLAKSFRRDGLEIEVPTCFLIDSHCGFKNLPAISHGGLKTQEAVNSSLRGISHFVSQLNQSDNAQSLSFSLAWNIDDGRSVVISFMGAIPDLSAWLDSFNFIPVSRDEFRTWLENQVKFVRQHGRDDISPINASHIQSDGTFFQKRRIVQGDVTLIDIKFEDGVFWADMKISEGKEELLFFINSGKLAYTPMFVIDSLKCTETGHDYMSSPFIAAFGETTCQITKIKNLFFVWCRKQLSYSS